MVPTVLTHQVTELLFQWRGGDLAERERLIAIIYDDLRHMARRCLAHHRCDHTLQSAALVHEAYLRLINGSAVDWQDRTHFFALAATVMRRVLVDYARMRGAAKRGANGIMLTLDEAIARPGAHNLDVVALDDALTCLAALDTRQSKIVELRFFCGLSIEETSTALGISPATVKREWATARTWLYKEMTRTA
jgi:RNA polymerase sigma factor (TIGR02999 family)